jgi:hypothetical protein
VAHEATDAAALERAAARAGVSLAARGETLDVEAFARMAEALESPDKPEDT